MKLIIAILGLGLISVAANATPAPLLSADCKAELEATALSREQTRLRNAGATAAEVRNLQAKAWANGTASGSVSVRVRIEETNFSEGRSVSYTGTATAAQRRACNVSIRRDTKNACRYSNGSEEGQDLEDIEGLAIRSNGTIKAGARLMGYIQAQIRAAFADGDTEISIADIINNTDDREILAFVVRLPSGRLLDYYKAYGGDNPHGVMFKYRTTTVAGYNSDGDLCVLEGND